MINPLKDIKTITAAILTGCFFVLMGCENDINVVRNLGKKKIGVDEVLQVETYMSQNGKPAPNSMPPDVADF